MRKIVLFFLSISLAFASSAQEDLLNMMQTETPQQATPVYATFKSTRVINLQSNETMKAKHLDFRIQHRFGQMNFEKENNYGTYDLLGLDGAVIRLGLEYGITDKIMVGLGRSNVGKTYDGFLKIKLMEQTKGKNAFPISIGYFGNMAINTLEWVDKSRDNKFTSRLTFVNQLTFTRKFNDYVSIIVSPTFVHRNLVATSSIPNDIYAIGIGGSFRISRSTRFNIEYIPRLNGRDVVKDKDGNALYKDALSVGFDIETGGHVFQLHFTNSTGLIEQQFVTETIGDLAKMQIRFGFNISRTFSFDRD